MPLDPDALGILAFEKHFTGTGQAKASAIVDQFGLSPIRYYQRLNQLLDVPAALAAEPVLVNRLRRIRERRRDRLHGRPTTAAAANAWAAAAAVTLSLPRQRSVQHHVDHNVLTATSTFEEHPPRG